MQPSEEELEQQQQEELARANQQRINDSIREAARLEQQALVEEQAKVEEIEVAITDTSSQYQRLNMNYRVFGHSG